MRSVRRTIAIIFAVLALGGTAVGAEGCGSGGHLVAGIVAHHVLNHFVHSAAGRRRLNKLFCLYHGHRVLVDIHHGHDIIAGLNAIEAFKACKAGFFHSK
jgi:hypothetical protein